MRLRPMHPARAYTLFEFFKGLALSMTNTVYVPYLIGLGLSYAEVAQLNAFFWGMIVLAELPTGMWADGKSRLWSIRVGVAIATMSALGYAFVHGFWGALICEVAMGVSFAFLSGAQQAWIVDALDHLGESARRREVIARSKMFYGLGMVLGGLSGAFIGSANPRFAWIAEAVGAFIGLLVALIFMRDQGEPVKRVSEIEALRQSTQLLRRHRGLMWAVAAAMIFGLVLPFSHYWAPFFRERVGQVGLGYLWVPMYLALTSASLAVRSERVIFHGVSGVLLAIFISGASLTFLGMGQGLLLPISLLLIHELGRGLYEPTLDLYIHDHVESSWRATYGSLQSFLGKMSYGVILLVVWLATRDSASTSALITQVWFISGGLLTLSALALWWLRPRN